MESSNEDESTHNEEASSEATRSECNDSDLLSDIEELEQLFENIVVYAETNSELIDSVSKKISSTEKILEFEGKQVPLSELLAIWEKEFDDLTDKSVTWGAYVFDKLQQCNE